MAIEIKKHSFRYVIIFLLIFTALVFFFQSSDAPYPRHGDVFTDAAAIMAAENFIEHGVVNLKYALLFTNPPSVDNFGFPLLYLHHPTFPGLMLALFYYLGFSTIQARIFPLLISATGLLATYLLGKKVFDESWGWGAMLAITAAAPFRLLSDQFFIEPYVFVVKAWAFFVIVSASYTTSSKRRNWLIALGILGYTVMSVAGWESLLQVGIFTILFPLFLLKESLSYKVRLIKQLAIALTAGLLLGGLIMFVQRIWVFGGIGPVFQDLQNSFQFRASAGPLSITNYAIYVFARLLRFYPLHILVIFLFLPIFLRAVKLRNNYRLDDKIIKFILILLVSESAWYILLREHTFEHDHTISFLLLSIGFGTTLGIKMFYTLAKTRNFPKWFFAIPVTAMWIASFFNVGVVSIDGNIQVNSNILEYSQQQIDFLTSRLNRNDVLVLDTTRYYYMYQSFALFQAHQLFIAPENMNIISQNKKLFIAEPFREKYSEYIGEYYLKAVVPPIAIFDPSLPPGPLNQIFKLSGNNIVKVDDRIPALFAFMINPPSLNAPQELSFSLLPDGQRILSFMLAQPLEILKKGLSDGVNVDFVLIKDGLEHHLLMATLSPKDKAWVPVEIMLPALSHNAILKISVTCGDKNDCTGDQVFLAPVFEQ